MRLAACSCLIACEQAPTNLVCSSVVHIHGQELLTHGTCHDPSDLDRTDHRTNLWVVTCAKILCIVQIITWKRVLYRSHRSFQVRVRCAHKPGTRTITLSQAVDHSYSGNVSRSYSSVHRHRRGALYRLWRSVKHTCVILSAGV